MLVGSVANGLNSSGGLHIVVDHQRINGTSFVLSGFRPSRLSSQSPPHPSEHAVHPKYPTRKCPGDLGRSGPCRHDHGLYLARRLAYDPHPPTFSDPVVGCDSEGPVPNDPCFARATVVPYCRRGACGVVDEVLAQGVWITRARPSPWTGAH